MKNFKRLRKLNERILYWINELPLTKKITILIMAVGIIPLGVTFVLFQNEIKKSSYEKEIYMINQGYEQFYQAVSDRLVRVYNISSLIAVNETINNTFQYKENQDEKESLEAFKEISEYSYALELCYDSSKIVYYIDDRFLMSATRTGRFRSMELAKETTWYDKLHGNNEKAMWVNFEDSTQFESEEYMALVRSIWNQRDYTEEIGVVAILIPKKTMRSILTSSEEDQYIYLMSKQKELLIENTTEDSLFSFTNDNLILSKKKFVKQKLNNEAYLVRSDVLENNRIYLVSAIPNEKINKSMKESVYKVGIIYLMISLVILLVVYPLTQSITKRIHLLRIRMGQIQEGTILKLEMEPHKDEIGELITSYDQMVEDLQELLANQYKMGQEKMGAELKALQSQINPHFLYNTLDMINWMAQKNETENIRGVIQSLSMFYRLTLNKGKDIVTIRDEIKLCQAYMEIQRRRFRGRIRFEEEVQEEVLNYVIPKITLQPLIENAILHGICEKEDGRGVVMLSAWEEGDRICISITDDGVGMKEEVAEKKTGGSHYGIKNIEKRLSIYFEESILLQVSSSLGVGTCVTIEIPKRNMES
ncbi:sensor histidine kinase [Anaerosporobacter sp.]|uniref:sensor histidine kinase n=1 Tax=Anaerosporobacter sp. TaxID=1872529 RepID=UPI00286ED38F|nr:sensor histidine kinase [Anaerosporobacter sp.]